MIRTIMRKRLGRSLLLAGILATVATNASARIVEAIPEPSVLSLTGIGIVIAIIAYRMKGGK